MKCAVHPEVDVSGYCRNCGKPMCAACVRPVHDVLYCEECLAHVMGVPGPQAANPSRNNRNGGYSGRTCSGRASSEAGCRKSRACVHTRIYSRTGSNLQRRIQQGDYSHRDLCRVDHGDHWRFRRRTGRLLDRGARGFHFLYGRLTALRTAKSRQTGEPLKDPIELWSAKQPLGPIILIGVGALILLNNFGIFERFRIGQFFWPGVLIGIGVVLLRKRMSDQK